jgi:hypothetical protein
MPVIKCGSGLSSTRKTKEKALKWLESLNEWPCSGPCPKSADECYRGETVNEFRSVKTKDIVWVAQVFCLCGPTVEPPEGEKVAAWTQGPPADTKPD